MKRFVILGLPRSGTTYLMTMLDSHRDVICSGEQFNPYAVVDVHDRDDRYETVLARDRDPVGHMTAFFERAQAQGVACGGFKYMIGHNIAILRALAADPDISIIYVWRENKLAQAVSLIKAAKTKKWAQTRRDAHLDMKVKATPMKISHHWHEYATFDHLVALWLAELPNPKVTYEYRDLFQPDFKEGICGFLGIDPHRSMRSPLVKQGSNEIAARFENGGGIRYFFDQIGFGHWSKKEL